MVRPSELTTPRGEGAFKSEWIADGEHLLPHHQGVGVAQRQRGELAAGVDANQRQVVARVRTQDFRLVDFLVGQGDGQLRGAADHVVIGENFAGGLDDKTRAGSFRGRNAEEPVLAIHHRRDIHGGVAGILINRNIVLLVGRKSSRFGGGGLAPQAPYGTHRLQQASHVPMCR
jgi:hypothetical protein